MAMVKDTFPVRTLMRREEELKTNVTMVFENIALSNMACLPGALSQ